MSANGVAQSSGPPANAPFSTLMPCSRPPRITPWQNAARVEPPAKAKFQYCLAGRRDPAELEGHAAEDQRQQHDDDRQIERRHDHRVGLREGDPQAAAAEHQPGLVAVPERRDRVHHLVALAFAARERKQDADAEVEAVEDDVERDRGADQRGPDHRKVPFHGGSPASALRRQDLAAGFGGGRQSAGSACLFPAAPRRDPPVLWRSAG